MRQDGNALSIPKVSIKINEVTVDMIVDTGASTDILNEVTYCRINHRQNIKLQPSTKCLFAYGSESQLAILGKFDSTITFKDSHKVSTVHVLQGSHSSVLSYKTAIDLGVLDLYVHHTADTSANHEQLVHQYPNLFHGVGKLQRVEVALHIDPTITPVAQQARRIPFHLHKKVEEELEHLKQQGIIEKVDGPTPWVSPLVLIPKKNGHVRICVDMRMANKAMF